MHIRQHLITRLTLTLKSANRKGAISLSLDKLKSFIFLSLLIILSSCSNSPDEFDTYFNDTYPEIEDKAVQAEKSTQEYMNLILGAEPYEAIELLNNQVIPQYEVLLEKLDNVDLTDTGLAKFNKLSQEVTKINLEKRLYSKNLFEEIITAHEKGDLNESPEANAVDGMHDLNEKYLKKLDEQVKSSEELADKYDQLKFDRINSISVDLDTLNDAYDELVAIFIESLAELSKNEAKNTIDEALITDQGNSEVMLNGEVTVFEDHFLLKGKSNLLGGSILNVKSYQYGSENPYFKGDFQVDKDGSFELEMDIDKKALDNEPFIVEIGYLPETSDDIDAQNIYGKEGTKLKGPFKHKYTSIKRTYFGAFAYAYLELTPGTTAEFEYQDIDIPDDYGDLNVWMEKESVEKKDNYYDIKMKSNLNELTKIDASVKVVDYDVAGLTSNAIVGPDGSFRFRIPRPDPKKINHEDVMIKIEATSEGAIETEELYGEHGMEFKGDLVNETKRGKKIEYKLHLGKDS